MPNVLESAQYDDQGNPGGSVEARLGEIESIARETESQCRSWSWLQSLSGRRGDRRVSAIVYPGTMAGAASLVHRLERAGIPWRTLDNAVVHGTADSSGVVAISLRVVDERLIFDGERIRVHAGYSASALAHAAAERGLPGLEFLAEVSGSLGAALRRGYEGYIWHVIDELLLARHGSLKAILTRGERLAGDQRTVVEGGLILAATLRLFREDREATLRLAREATLRVADDADE